jgi:hypothetical protein
VLIGIKDQSMGGKNEETENQIIEKHRAVKMGELNKLWSLDRVEKQFRMEKKHSKEIRSTEMCDRKECRGEFKRHYYSIFLIFMHNNYLFFLFSMSFSS